MEFTFTDDFLEEKLMLFELPSEGFLQDVLSGNTKLEFVSCNDQPIVLCSQNQTFELFEFDTSNTLLIHDGPTIISRAFSTFELREKKPPFLTFRQLLHSNPITQSEVKSGIMENPFVYDDLRNNILCSAVEFDEILTRLCAINIESYVKTPPQDLQDLIVEQIFRYSQTLSDWKRININSMMNSLNFPLAEYPIMKSIIYSILKAYSITINSDEATLNENMIMRFIARGILSHARNGFITFEDFKNEMNGQMPPDMRLNIDNLYGLFAPIKNGLQYINEESLPFEIEQRFEFLFKIKKEWNQNEIEPFFVDFVTSKLSFQDFASRHVRLAEGKWMKR